MAQRSWPFELLTHFWPQVCAALFVSGLVGLATRRRIAGFVHLASGLALLTMLVGIRPWDPTRVGSVTKAGTSGELHSLFANVGRQNREYGRLLDLVAEERPDVIGLAEIDPSWMEALAPLDAEYPYRLVVPRRDYFGIGLLSRFPLSDTTSVPIGRTGIPGLAATVETPDGPWRILVAHTAVPVHRAAFSARNSLIAKLGDVVGGPAPAVVLADLNASVWSPFVRDLAREGLRPASSGLRSLYTWPVFFPPLGLGLDHCLISGDAVTLSFEVLRSIGSDHFPIACRIGRIGG